MKILILDTVYPEFLKTVPFDENSTYEVELRKVLDRQFGTADFYSKNLKALRWDAVDVIANHRELQLMFARQRWNETFGSKAILYSQVQIYEPDVIFFQDLSLLDRQCINEKYLVAAQLSCPWPGDETVRQCDVIFTSFPHYITRIEKLGVRAIYNPLAFEPSVLDAAQIPRGILEAPKPLSFADIAKLKQEWRIHDCVFIGGVGNPSHWKRGMETLETVAREIPTFKWWGYGVETLPANSALREKYQGQAWGCDMYDILLRSKIVLNRHGEVAEGHANNMRLYEATGCGAMLLTERVNNVWNLFTTDEIVTYMSPGHAVQKIQHYLAHEDERAAIAAKGQKRTLSDHTYAKRMKVVSDALKEMLVTA